MREKRSLFQGLLTIGRIADSSKSELKCQSATHIRASMAPPGPTARLITLYQCYMSWPSTLTPLNPEELTL
jgi:hypothetical protein